MVSMVILDRDGVINHDSDHYIKSAQEWQPIDGSLEAISRLKKAGYPVTVATNQSGIGRGLYDLATLEQMHDKLRDLLRQRGAEIDGIYFCPHTPADNCTCRKPRSGLLLRIARDFGIDLTDAVFVGDTITDIQAARMVGAQPVLVKTGKGLDTLDRHGSIEDVPVYDNLQNFVREFLKK